MDEDTILLLEIAMIMIAAGVAAIIFSKLRLPVIIGYLFAGILLGPKVLPIEIVANLDIVNLLANMGIILLMFSIGLDFNIKRLRKIGMFAVLAGSIELVIMIIIGYELGQVLGWGYIESIFLGAVLAISSTAVIVRVLTETGNMKKPFADAIIGLLIVEDLAAVIILTMISPLAIGQAPGLESIFGQLIGILVFIALSLILGIAVIPKAINYVGKNFSDEVLMMVALGFCFGMSIFAYSLGLSVAIGAFILGVILSESREWERIVLKISSIKEMFMAIFFVSIGLLIDPNLVLNSIPLILIVAAAFLVGKLVAVSVACLVANRDSKTSIMAGFTMMAMGEFSFVIAKVGLDSGVISNDFYSDIIAVALITMIAMPIIFKRSGQIMERASRLIPRGVLTSARRLESMRTELSRCLEARADRRRKVFYQVFWIVIDFVILFGVQVFVLAVYDISLLLKPIADWLAVVPSFLAAVVSVALIIPPVIDILIRVRKLGYEVVEGILDTGTYSRDSGRFILKMFINFVTIIVGIILFLLVLPFGSSYEEFPLIPIVGIIIGILIAYLVWDANKATYQKMCTVLTTGLIGDEKNPEK
ncbi:MAG TPA: cation:proton antiporter [Methanomassiliicoccales archaeon]|nr:cation:proton antiporter [Methanomassiliicoccales archaeon]